MHSTKQQPTLSVNGISMPDDFPTGQYEAIHSRIASYINSNPDAYAHYAGAWNAVSYRYMALVEYGDAFTRSVIEFGTSPEARIRYEQERSLFGFFSNSSSVFEAFFFAMFAIGSMLDPQRFLLTAPKDQRRVSPKYTSDTFYAFIPADPINSIFSSLLNDDAYKEGQEIRNILTHRSAPGRTFFMSYSDGDIPPSEWKLSNIRLDQNTASQRRLHTSRLLTLGMTGAKNLIVKHFS